MGHLDFFASLCLWAVAGFVDTMLSWHSAGLKLHGAEIAQFRMPSAGVVKALDAIEYIGMGFVAVSVTLRAVRSVFSEEKKLSIADLAMVSRTSCRFSRAKSCGGFNRSAQHH